MIKAYACMFDIPKVVVYVQGRIFINFKAYIIIPSFIINFDHGVFTYFHDFSLQLF
jgi:hypothetical protein